MIKTILITFSIILTSINLSFSEETESIPLKELKNKADKILKLPNVSARKEIDVVFQLADRLIEENNLSEAETYIKSGLEHYPWNLKHQMIYAEMMSKKGNLTEAEEKAELVYTYAESEELIEHARQLLSKKEIAAFPPISKVSGTNHCVVLIPFQECEKWLISRIREALSSTLSIPVYIQSIETEYPSFNRDQRGRTVNRMRKQLTKGLDDPELKNAMSELGISEEDLRSDDNVIKLMRHLLSSSEEASTEHFDTFLKDAIGKDPQWDTDHLQTVLMRAVKPYRRQNVAYLAITSVDIYSDDYNFLFGSANRSGGVMSYHRFKASFNDEIPNQDRLAKRTTMQCLSSIGHIYRVKKCTNPTCARAYPNSLSEHDAKTGTLCFKCSSGFKKEFEPVN